MNLDWLPSLEKAITYEAKDKHCLLQALTHKSYLKKKPTHPVGNNERLEFIGDAVVDLVIADDLYRIFPLDNEGSLSRKRASLVNEESLYKLSCKLQLENFLLVEDSLRTNRRLLAGALEAVIGAIFLDSGFEVAQKWIRELFEKEGFYQFNSHDFEKDYKTRFQEHIQEKFKVTPIYRTIHVSGPDHQKIFEVEVLVGDDVYGVGRGENKKMAEQVAAERALQRIKDVV